MIFPIFPNSRRATALQGQPLSVQYLTNGGATPITEKILCKERNIFEDERLMPVTHRQDLIWNCANQPSLARLRYDHANSVGHGVLERVLVRGMNQKHSSIRGLKSPRSMLVTLVLVSFVVLFWVFSRRNHEPFYSGKSLSFWLVGLRGPVEQRSSATNALRSWGTNVVPYLMEMRFKKDHKAEGLIRNIVHTLGRKTYRSGAEQRRYLARSGLKTLGPIAASMLTSNLAQEPFIGTEDVGTPAARLRAFRATEDHPAEHAAEVLFYDVGPPSVPALTAYLTNDIPAVRYHACYTIASKPAGEILQSPELVEELSLRLIERVSSDTDFRVRSMALAALNQLRLKDEGVVKAYVEALFDPNSCVRYLAAVYLKEQGPLPPEIVVQVREALGKEQAAADRPASGTGWIVEKTKQQVIGVLSDTMKKIQPAESN